MRIRRKVVGLCIGEMMGFAFADETGKVYESSAEDLASLTIPGAQHAFEVWWDRHSIARRSVVVVWPPVLAPRYLGIYGFLSEQGNTRMVTPEAVKEVYGGPSVSIGQVIRGCRERFDPEADRYESALAAAAAWMASGGRAG